MEYPAHSQLAHIILVDLIQRTEPSPGVVAVVRDPIRADWLGKQGCQLDIDTHGSGILLGRRKISRQRQAPDQDRLCKEVSFPTHEAFTPPDA